uniref:Uncharacterized protein n=1 Tax=Rhizophora mucronata TaxID=61149 RepID=A0A2P2ITV0_RHIMU
MYSIIVQNRFVCNSIFRSGSRLPCQNNFGTLLSTFNMFVFDRPKFQHK